MNKYNHIIDNITSLIDENKVLNKTLEDKLNEINSLNIKIDTLERELKEKSSKAIWQNTQTLLKQKDDEIDNIKRQLDYQTRKNVKNVNVNKIILNNNKKDETLDELEKELFN